MARREVAELSGCLYNDVDTRALQLFGWDQPDVGDTAHAVTYWLDSEHVKGLGESRALGFYKFTSPESIADLTRPVLMFLEMSFQCRFCQ